MVADHFMLSGGACRLPQHTSYLLAPQYKSAFWFPIKSTAGLTEDRRPWKPGTLQNLAAGGRPGSVCFSISLPFSPSKDGRASSSRPGGLLVPPVSGRVVGRLSPSWSAESLLFAHSFRISGLGWVPAGVPSEFYLSAVVRGPDNLCFLSCLTSHWDDSSEISARTERGSYFVITNLFILPVPSFHMSVKLVSQFSERQSEIAHLLDPHFPSSSLRGIPPSAPASASGERKILGGILVNEERRSPTCPASPGRVISKDPCAVLAGREHPSPLPQTNDNAPPAVDVGL
ncbi:hypothetical protein B0T24DRAFT_105485 [Lasiosphaeria ovina]|uniref:Uncharacterized protein n=1 Tax=Lasiosphaeria ovina TaxID=92902 RepID=A0AAE0MYV9_9PEZI|nr:hypothetical protein B0T24DRAFT_105485 [Lasiosphaeria ovina]